MAPPAAESTITIHNFAFGASITVKAGATVTVKNGDTTTHTLAADDGSFDTGNIFAGKSATFVAPMQPGPYKFHCNIHANMHASSTSPRDRHAARMMHAEAASLLGAVALRAASEIEQRRVRDHARSRAGCSDELGRYDVVVALRASTETNTDGPQTG